MRGVQLVDLRNLLYCGVAVTGLDRLGDAVFNCCLRHGAWVLQGLLVFSHGCVGSAGCN